MTARRRRSRAGTQADAALCDVYERSWPNLLAVLRSEPELSNPVLIERPVRWRGDDQGPRLLVVGQETGPGRWQPDLAIRNRRAHRASVTELMRRYSSFKQDQSAGTTHFWRFLRVLELRLGLEAGQALWTNLNRCDHLGGRPTLIEDRLWSAFPVLCDELKILRPTAVVFVTGPSYDALLVRRLGASLVPVRGFATAAFARVESPGLLPPESFRTYHPNFLCRFRASSVPRIVNYIAKRVRQDAARLEPRPALRGRVAAARAPE